MATPHILSTMQDGIVIMASEAIVPQAQKVADHLRALALPTATLAPPTRPAPLRNQGFASRASSGRGNRGSSRAESGKVGGHVVKVLELAIVLK